MFQKSVRLHVFILRLQLPENQTIQMHNPNNSRLERTLFSDERILFRGETPLRQYQKYYCAFITFFTMRWAPREPHLQCTCCFYPVLSSTCIIERDFAYIQRLLLENFYKQRDCLNFIWWHSSGIFTDEFGQYGQRNWRGSIFEQSSGKTFQIEMHRSSLFKKNIAKDFYFATSKNDILSSKHNGFSDPDIARTRLIQVNEAYKKSFGQKKNDI